MTLRDILTPRQFQFAQMIRWGMSNKEIAKLRGNSESAVKQGVAKLYERAGCSSETGYLPRVELAVRFALEESEGKYR